MRVGSLFTGYGGLDMAVEDFFDAETVWCSDIDPGACKIIAHRMSGIPNLGDITAVDWATVEPVDILCGGWPCQPFSLAGKRKGAADERALWPFVAGAVRGLRPRIAILENVAAIATAGELARAVGDLSSLGYDARWGCLRAADVGAPHGRARIFILAADAGHAAGRGPGPLGGSAGGRLTTSELERPAATAADTDRIDLQGGDSDTDAARRRQGAAGRGDRGAGAPPDAASNGRQQGWPEPARLVGGSDAAQRSAVATDAECVRQLEASFSRGEEGAGLRLATSGPAHTAWGPYEPAIRRWERILGRTAPAPTQTSPKGSQRLSAHLVEWMMGLPVGWVCDVPGLTRNEQLKALGNGVVPQQALAALRIMASLEAAA